MKAHNIDIFKFANEISTDNDFFKSNACPRRKAFRKQAIEERMNNASRPW